MMRTKIRRDGGFTMVELMMVVAILGILVTIAVMSYVAATGNARTVTCLQNQRTLQDAIPVYAAQNDSAPDDIDDLRPFVTDFDLAVSCPNEDGTNLQLDAASQVISCPNHP